MFTSCDQVKLADIKKNATNDSLNDESFKNKLFVYVIESKIMSKQLVGSEPVSDFVHLYMLRGSLAFVKSNNLDSIVTPNTFKDSIQAKNILLEYFTGHKCGNCPTASKPIFDEIEKSFSKNVNIIKIHASTFANPSSSYPNDFRTDLGNELLLTFGVNNLPVGMIDRVDFQGASRLMSPTDWLAKIQSELDLAPTFGIWETHTYDESTLDITTKIKVKNLRTNKLYALTFKDKLKANWIVKNCKLVLFLTDANGNVLQSVSKAIL